MRGNRKTDKYDAAKDLAERWPGWIVHLKDLAGVPEVICCDERKLLLDVGAWPEGEAYAVAHALAHLDLGHHERYGTFTAEHEAEADWLAQVRLDLPREGGNP